MPTNNSASGAATKKDNTFKAQIGQHLVTGRDLGVDSAGNTFEAKSKYAAGIVPAGTEFRYLGRETSKSYPANKVKVAIIDADGEEVVLYMHDNHLNTAYITKGRGVLGAIPVGARVEELSDEDSLEAMELRVEELRELLEAKKAQAAKEKAEKEKAALAAAIKLLEASGAKVVLPSEETEVEGEESVS